MRDPVGQLDMLGVDVDLVAGDTTTGVLDQLRGDVAPRRQQAEGPRARPGEPPAAPPAAAGPEDGRREFRHRA